MTSLFTLTKSENTVLYKMWNKIIKEKTQLGCLHDRKIMNSRVWVGGEEQENDDCFTDWNTTKIIQIRIKEPLLIYMIFHYDKKSLSLVEKMMCFFRGHDTKVVTSCFCSPSACRYIHWLFLLGLLAVMCIKPHTSPCNGILKNVFITDTLENIQWICLHLLSLALSSYTAIFNLLEWILQ